jgi:hypothetical protein
LPAHRKRKPQSRRATLVTALVIAVALFIALIGFGGKPKHSTPAAQTQTESPSPSSTSTNPPSPRVTTSVARAPLSPSATPSKPKPTPSPAKPTPTRTSSGLGTTDASLQGLTQRVQAQPVRIQIPALHVDASVIPAGVTSAGALEVPENVTQAAWFQAGNAPGQGGPAIIAAHVDFAGKLGLFNGLHALKKGDVILITDFSRHVHKFTAVTGRLFPKNDPSTVQSLAEASARPGQPLLALITCGGALNTAKHSYYDNYVLLADGK